MERTLIDPALYPMKYSEVKLNQAEIQALNTTPILLIDKPGKSVSVRLEKCIVIYDGNGTAFAGAATGIQLQFAGNADALLGVVADGFLAETGKINTPIIQAVYTGEDVLKNNQAVEITALNDMTLGDAAGFLKVMFWYTEVPLTA